MVVSRKRPEGIILLKNINSKNCAISYSGLSVYRLCIFIWFVSFFFKFSTNQGYKHLEGKDLAILHTRHRQKTPHTFFFLNIPFLYFNQLRRKKVGVGGGGYNTCDYS